jgi:hypothetical protein
MVITIGVESIGCFLNFDHFKNSVYLVYYDEYEKTLQELNIKLLILNAVA